MAVSNPPERAGTPRVPIMAIRSLSGFTAVNGVLSKGGGAAQGWEPKVLFDATAGHGDGGGSSTRRMGRR